MLKKLMLLGLIVPFVLFAEERTKEAEVSKVPALTEPADAVPAIKEVAPENTVTEAPDKYESHAAKKAVLMMLGGFTKMAENRKKYLEGKQSHDEYIQKDAKIADSVSSYIDFWDVCEKSLKYDYDFKRKKFRHDHWKGKSQLEKAHFQRLFMNLIEEIVYPIANEYFGDLKMTHKVITAKKDDVYIKTTVLNTKKRKNREFIMEWFLHPSNNGTWTVYDVGVEGERWVEGFRSQFNDVITKKSYKELIKMMNKKLAEVKEDRFNQDKKDLEDAKAKASLAEKEVKK